MHASGTAARASDESAESDAACADSSADDFSGGTEEVGAFDILPRDPCTRAPAPAQPRSLPTASALPTPPTGAAWRSSSPGGRRRSRWSASRQSLIPPGIDAHRIDFWEFALSQSPSATSTQAARGGLCRAGQLVGQAGIPNKNSFNDSSRYLSPHFPPSINRGPKVDSTPNT